uniref:Uncharacterized protein n=1 Tax=Latimeria chalumnae TaxID=7897 RepID=H3A9E9_LATCH|nr:PREDICTED: interferon-induced transmembrane protein 1-like [Latimeria chalumnae]|eukprot:XP_014353736.1 PREDICTED: interferon-induced transmembrane protein 1-like [Latimeria chalumnae]
MSTTGFTYPQDNVPLSNRIQYEALQNENRGFPTATMINIGPPVEVPRDHFLWSIFNTLFGNFCCLGFLALIFSVKSRDRKVVQDMEGARHYGSTARCLNITALVFNIILAIIAIILLVIYVQMLIEMIQNNSKGWNEINNYGK